DELTWELTIRACEVASIVEQKRSQLRDAIQQNILDNPNVQLDPSVKLSICSAKLDELVGYIQEFDEENRHNEFKRINSRLLHIQGRLSLVIPSTRELELKKNNLIFLLSGALEALDDANRIANLYQPGSSQAGGMLDSVNASSRQFGTSLLDSPNILIPEVSVQPNRLQETADPIVAQLVDLGPEQHVCTSPRSLDRLECSILPPIRSITNNNNFRTNFEADDMHNFAQRVHQRACMQLVDRLTQIALSSNNNWPLISPGHSERRQTTSDSLRRVFFATNVMNRNHEQLFLYYPLSDGDVDLSGCENHDSDGISLEYHRRRGCCAYTTGGPVYKWDISYDGNGSVTSFIEEVEQLSDSRNISKEQLFHSVYEILRGDARDWYLPRKPSFTDWKDFKYKLREAFLPLNYEDNLLDDIKRRTQGPDERLILYVTRMQNLYEKLTVKRPPEACPYQEQFVTASSNFPNETHLSYRRLHNRQVPVRAIQSHNPEPRAQSSLSHVVEHSQSTAAIQSIQNSQPNQHFQSVRRKGSASGGSTTGRRVGSGGELRVGSDMVEPFNPEEKFVNVDRLTMIDDLGEVHCWSDYEKSYFMQIIPVVRREPGLTGWMISHAHGCGIVGEKAVSCIIRGLPGELRANAYVCRCATPEALYSEFLAGLESYQTPVAAGSSKRGKSSVHRKRVQASGICGVSTVKNWGTSGECPERRIERCRSFQQARHKQAEYIKRRRMDNRSDSSGGRNVRVGLVSTNSDKTYKRMAYIKGKRVKVYLDTGCQCNLMAAECAERLRLQSNRRYGRVTLVAQNGMVRFCKRGDAGEESREKVETELRSISLEETNTRRRVVLNQDITLAPGEEVYMEHMVFAERKGGGIAAIASAVLCQGD
ncbi:hypothetical protein NQ314_002470, partial [Rhamnusium bicolor]